MANKPKKLCALCGKNYDLQNSHIIPKWCYKNSFNEKHQLKIATSPDLFIKAMQDGFKEYLLCKECEGIFSEIEGYASRILIGSAIDQDRVFAYQLNNIDAIKIKRFLLSIVWRCSVSSQKVFSNINVGEHHSRVLQRILLSKDSIDPQSYPTLVYRLVDKRNDNIKDLIRTPTTERIYGYKCARILFSGYLFHIFVTSHRVPAEWEAWVLKNNGVMRVQRTNIANLEWLGDEIRSLSESGRLKALLPEKSCS